MVFGIDKKAGPLNNFCHGFCVVGAGQIYNQDLSRQRSLTLRRCTHRTHNYKEKMTKRVFSFVVSCFFDGDYTPEIDEQIYQWDSSILSILPACLNSVLAILPMNTGH
jgi:hypothetical protein